MQLAINTVFFLQLTTNSLISPTTHNLEFTTHNLKVYLLSTNITSPLGMTTEENYLAVRLGRTALAHHDNSRGVPFPFHAALFSDEQWADITLPGHTRFESMVLRSVREALTHTRIDVSGHRTVFILSTTKGDILTPPGDTARRIARELGVTTEPIVVCNACISGAAAQILALRLMASGFCDCAIVAGGDVLGSFIISGFHSLKALSPVACRPFDAERLGLNLGEAAATMIFHRTLPAGRTGAWQLADGAIRNDAFHISGPHPQGEGCLRALMQVIDDKDNLALIGVHGTATMYNDQMESKAIERAGLSDVPLSALKGYYGHTLGAAGLLETIVTARALDDGIILSSLGYQERGVSGRVTISPDTVTTDKREFIKILSGFGGGNAAIRLTRRAAAMPTVVSNIPVRKEAEYTLPAMDMETVTEIYRKHIGNYPKFHKMDVLSRVAFIATELLLRDNPECNSVLSEQDYPPAVILFNRTSSVVADRLYMETIADAANYYPGPSLFVHTLPNISTGEIALRHAIHGETSFYILPRCDETLMQSVISASLLDSGATSVIAGWIDCPDTEHAECSLALYRKG